MPALQEKFKTLAAFFVLESKLFHVEHLLSFRFPPAHPYPGQVLKLSS